MLKEIVISIGWILKQLLLFPVYTLVLVLFIITFPWWEHWWKHHTTPDQRTVHMNAVGVGPAVMDVFGLWLTRQDIAEWYSREGYILEKSPDNEGDMDE